MTTLNTPLIERIIAFIEDVRNDAATFEDANLKPGGIIRLSESLQRLYVLIGDYQAANAAFLDHFRRQKEVHATIPAGETRQLSPDEERQMRPGWPIQLELHLRIDAFYVSAKILLDDMGKAIQEFLGRAEVVAEVLTYIEENKPRAAETSG